MSVLKSVAPNWLKLVRNRLGLFAKSQTARRPDLDAACRELMDEPLDETGTRAAVAEYWTESGAHNYEKNWRGRLQEILQVIQDGETALSRAVAETLRRVEAKRNESLQPVEYVAFNEKVTLPHIGGGYLHRGSILRTVVDCCTPETTSVLELGSGWGEHLCNLWLSGGPTQADYYACELSEFGRKCTLALGMLDTDFKLQAKCFNYVSPDFGFLPKNQKEVVIYSVHSVEQVKELATDLIDRMCDTGPKVTGVHFEPVGWQLIPQGEWNEVTTAHHRRCKDQKYNENLWSLLKKAESAGRITIEKAIPNYFGMAYNPASLIVWRKR